MTKVFQQLANVQTALRIKEKKWNQIYNRQYQIKQIIITKQNNKVRMGNRCCNQIPNQSEMERPVSIRYLSTRQNNIQNADNQKFKQQDVSQVSNELSQKGKIHEGQITLPDGSTYKGQIKNGVPHGKGTQHHQIGDKYIGQFCEGHKQGIGTYQYHNGIVYQGQFKKGDISGRGKMRWVNGDWYEGQFENNLIHGNGRYFCKQTNSYFQGTYFKGKRHGKGKIISNNNTLQGNWQNGQFVFKKQVKFPQ